MTAVGTAWMHSAPGMLAFNCAILFLLALTVCSVAQLWSTDHLRLVTLASSAKNGFHLNTSHTHINIIFTQTKVSRLRATETKYLHNITKQTRRYTI
jgi:hypothetical protein